MDTRRPLTDREIECLRTVAACTPNLPATPHFLIRGRRFGRKLLLRLCQWGLLAVSGSNFFSAVVTATPAGHAVLTASAAANAKSQPAAE